MRATTNLQQNFKNFGLVAASIIAATMLAFSWLVAAVNASSIIQVTSNIDQVPGGASLVLTVGVQDDGDVHELEIDHSLQDILPEFSVYADAANPYGGSTCGTGNNLDCATEFTNAGVTVTYSAVDSQWVINFGDNITDVIRANGNIDFYFTLRDADHNELWGSMNSTTPENTFNFDANDGTGDSLLPDTSDDDEDEDDEVIIPGVPNTSVAN